MIHLCPEVIDELQAREESVQDERGKYFHMFPNAAASIRELRQQPLLLDPSEVWMAASEADDVGQACGLFCHR